MVAKDPEDLGYAELAPLILKPLRKMRDVRPPAMALRMGISTRAYQDFEAGRTGLLVERVRKFAEILKLDHYAILAAFFLGKPQIAHLFAQNKLMLIQASAVDEMDEGALEAIAAVDPLTVLDAHLQFYRQLAEHGREQLRAANGRRPKDPC
jgi:hypothetical protein